MIEVNSTKEFARITSSIHEYGIWLIAQVEGKNIFELSAGGKGSCIQGPFQVITLSS